MDNDYLAASNTLVTSMDMKLAVRSETPLRNVLVAICRDTLAALYISNAGQIRYEVYSPTTADEVDLDEELGDFIVSPDVANPGERCYRTINVEYAFDGRFESDDGGAFLLTSYTEASSVGLLTGRVVDYPVGASLHQTEASAQILARRLAWFTSRGAPVYTIEASVRLFTLDLMARVRLLRARLPTSASDGYVHGYVTRIIRSPKAGKVTLEVTENRIADLLGSW